MSLRLLEAMPSHPIITIAQAMKLLDTTRPTAAKAIKSLIEAGILDGDFVVARVQDVVRTGDIVVAGIPGEEATVKTYRKERSTVVLEPANKLLEPMRFSPGEVEIFGKVVTVLRKL